ncbi:MAG TPA: hypothetical protein VLI06_01480 [Solimonas sp.]|nr:hypothetical protein [Solimonas sp.]
MPRLFRSSLLILVLLLESLGSALALPPPLVVAAQEQSAMPCHDEGSQAQMPCCDDGKDCRCSVNCFGAASALAPALAIASHDLRPLPDATALRPAPLPAHPRLLLRPPASFPA